MPAAGLNPLRVGPEDVEASEAGELVRKVGVGNQAKGLIKAVARGVPKNLRVAASRFEHVERSAYLDEDEVLAQAEETVGEGIIAKVLSARVRGDKSRPLDSNVVVLYEVPSGRTARCYVAYSEFPKSQRAFDNALKSGEVSLAPGEDPKAIVKQNERLIAEVERLTKESADAESGSGPSEEEIEERVKAKADELLTETISEAGFETREDLIGALKQLTGGDGDGSGSEEAADEVDAPEGKAKDLIAKVGDYSDDQLAALLTSEQGAEKPRSTVIDAVTDEQKRRAAGD